MAITNGFDNVDDNISSGSMSSGETLFSSTYGGDDTVTIFNPSYEIYLGNGNDSLFGGRGGAAYGQAGNDNLNVNLWQGTHHHYGGEGHDYFGIFFGAAGAAFLGYGGNGNDLFRDGSYNATSSTYNGGAGFDVVMHTRSDALQMTLGGSGTQGAATKSYVAVEGVVSGAGNDSLTGSSGNNLLAGGGGSDGLFGGSGNDFLIGDGREENFVRAYMGINPSFSPDDGQDPLNAIVAGTYSIDSGSLADSLFGGNGNDVLSGGDGGDVLNGGAGRDWVSYLSAPETAGVALSLATGGTAGHAAGDTFISVENVQGSHGHDTLAGNDLANEIRGMRGADLISGYSGNDTLLGHEGRDTLEGGRGVDVLTGGDAEDCFVFSSASLLSSDTITDFQINHDEIWLSAAVFRNVGAIGALSAGSFALGTAAGDISDRIIYDPTTGALIFDFNGSRVGGGIQFAQLSTGLALTEADFVVVA